MQLLSVNAGRSRLLQRNGQTVSTAIFKTPIDGPAKVTSLGLETDDQADKSCHGGEDKALYAYDQINYDWWRGELTDRNLQPGEFGENLTTHGMTDDQIAIGDIYRVGKIVVQVTSPRTPCLKLGLKFNDATVIKRFHQAARTGFYLRVVEAGVIKVGDEIQLEQAANPRMTVAEMYQLKFFDEPSTERFQQAAELKGLSETWRDDFLKLAQQATIS